METTVPAWATAIDMSRFVTRGGRLLGWLTRPASVLTVLEQVLIGGTTGARDLRYALERRKDLEMHI